MYKSQGRIYITSPSAFDPPVIDPQYFSHPADVTLMREGLKLIRRLGSTAPISNLLKSETSPGPSVNTDEEWEAWMVGQAHTEFHPMGTCAMLPLAQGGVVNAKLQVYGLANVRVADASVYPFEFSSHLGAPTYGLAEQAAQIIRAFHNGIAAPSDTAPQSTDHPTETPAANGVALTAYNVPVRVISLLTALWTIVTFL